MLLGTGCAAAGEVSQPDGGKKVERDWAVPGGLVEIYFEEEGYRVAVTMDDLANQTGAQYEYSCHYSAEKDALVSVASTRTDYTYAPDTGDKVFLAPAYEGLDEEQVTEFAIDSGFLIWKDGHDDAGAGLKFTDIGRFRGTWRNEAEQVEATFLWDGLDADTWWYTVHIQRGKSDANQFARYLMTGNYDPATNKLTAEGTVTVFTKNASGGYDTREDGEQYDAVFSMPGSGKLLYETANGIELEYDLMGDPT